MSADALPRPVPIPRPLTLGVLMNPASGTNRRRPEALARVRAAHPRLPWRDAHDPASVAAALDALAAAGTNVIAVSGGDGTVQAVLSVLFSPRSPFAAMPSLAVLRAGTTNMIAGDVGLAGRPERALAALLARISAGDGIAPVSRPILRVDAGNGRAPLCGMHFGAAAIVSGIEYCKRDVHRVGLRGEIGPGITLLRFAIAMARGGHGRLVPSMPLAAAIDSAPSATSDCWIVQATTLERLFLGLRPFWGTQAAPIHYTHVRAHPSHWLRALPALLRGRPNRALTRERGYSSCNADRIELRMDGRFTLDGELYSATREQPILITDAGSATFLQLR